MDPPLSRGLSRATTRAPLSHGQAGHRTLAPHCPPVVMVTLWRMVARGPGPRSQTREAADREDECGPGKQLTPPAALSSVPGQGPAALPTAQGAPLSPKKVMLQLKSSKNFFSCQTCKMKDQLCVFKCVFYFLDIYLSSSRGIQIR